MQGAKNGIALFGHRIVWVITLPIGRRKRLQGDVIVLSWASPCPIDKTTVWGDNALCVRTGTLGMDGESGRLFHMLTFVRVSFQKAQYAASARLTASQNGETIDSWFES